MHHRRPRQGTADMLFGLRGRFGVDRLRCGLVCGRQVLGRQVAHEPFCRSSSASQSSFSANTSRAFIDCSCLRVSLGVSVSFMEFGDFRLFRPKVFRFEHWCPWRHRRTPSRSTHRRLDLQCCVPIWRRSHRITTAMTQLVAARRVPPPYLAQTHAERNLF